MSSGSTKGSAIFLGFRALGLYSNHLAHVVRYHKKHQQFYVVTAVGKCFHTYNVSAFTGSLRGNEPVTKNCSWRSRREAMRDANAGSEPWTAVKRITRACMKCSSEKMCVKLKSTPPVFFFITLTEYTTFIINLNTCNI